MEPIETTAWQLRVLEMIASGSALADTLNVLMGVLEDGFPGLLASVLLLGKDGVTLHHLAAPSLPPEYCSAVDGVQIGPSVGSCGTAAFRAEQIIVEDIDTDPLWVNFRDLARRHGLRACWSTPITDSRRRVLGTLAFYFREPKRPADPHERLFAMATHMASIAIARAKGEDERSRLIHDLRERIKELGVVYGATQVFQHERSLGLGLLTELVLLLPAGWQFPEVCVARMAYGEWEATTPGWRDSRWKQTAAFRTADGVAGIVEVVYLEERPAEAEGPFLLEERKLIESFAELVGEHFERIRIQSVLRDNEARLKLSIQASNIGLWDLDVPSNRMYYSLEWKRQIGYNHDEIQPHFDEWVSRLHPEDRARSLENIRSCLDKPGLTYDVEFRLQHKDGSYRWIYARGETIRDLQGKPSRMVGCHIDVTERKRAETELHHSLAQLKVLSRRLVDTEESERRKINRELHDRIGQNLSTLSINLNLISGGALRGPSDELLNQIDRAQRLLEKTTVQVRDVMAELHPPALEEFGLYAAVRAHADALGHHVGKTIEVRGKDLVSRLQPAVEVTLFRVMQEALNNATKHARARHIVVALTEAADRVVLTISDDGVGFDPGRQSGMSWGLTTMRERAGAVGASLRIESAAGVGTTVIADYARNPA